MKEALFIVSILLTIHCFSQGSYIKGKLILKDGSEMNGLMSISGNKVKFKKDKKSIKENFAEDDTGLFRHDTAVKDMVNYYNENCNT